jgi:hypothetical protein
MSCLLLTFLQRWPSSKSRMQRRIDWYIVTKVLKQSAASIASYFYYPEDGSGKLLRNLGTYMPM